MLNIQVAEIFTKYGVLYTINFTPVINIYQLVPDDTAVTGRITNAVINGTIINSTGVSLYREEDSRNPIHYVTHEISARGDANFFVRL